MWAGTKIKKVIPLSVVTYNFPIRKITDEFTFKFLPFFREQFDRLLAAYFMSDDGQITLDDFLHLVLDLLEVLVGELVDAEQVEARCGRAVQQKRDVAPRGDAVGLLMAA